jgi:hypothetical protein
MKHRIHCLAAAALAALAQPATAKCGMDVAPPPPGADAPAQARAAHELASLYYPEAIIIAVVERQSRTAFEQGVRQSLGGETILQNMPELVDVWYEATMRIIRPCVAILVPNLQNGAAEVLGNRMSVAHMREVAAFYRSDTGRATMAALVQTLRPAQPRLRPDGLVEPMTRADIRDAIPTNFIDLLTPAQVADLARFGTSPHGQAFVNATPHLESLTVAAVNRLNAAAQPEIEAAVRTAIQDHLRRNPPAQRAN